MRWRVIYFVVGTALVNMTWFHVLGVTTLSTVAAVGWGLGYFAGLFASDNFTNRKAKADGMREAADRAENFHWQLPLYKTLVENSVSDDAAKTIKVQVASSLRARALEIEQGEGI